MLLPVLETAKNAALKPCSERFCSISYFYSISIYCIHNGQMCVVIKLFLANIAIKVLGR